MIALCIYIAFSYLFMLGVMYGWPDENSDSVFGKAVVLILSPIILPAAFGAEFSKWIFKK